VAATDGGTGQRRVVIACQGGGSHTAFTAGVLKRLLGADELAGYQVAGLSGTSGGAVCALLAWYALLDDDPVGAGWAAMVFLLVSGGGSCSRLGSQAGRGQSFGGRGRIAPSGRDLAMGQNCLQGSDSRATGR